MGMAPFGRPRNAPLTLGFALLLLAISLIVLEADWPCWLRGTVDDQTINWTAVPEDGAPGDCAPRSSDTMLGCDRTLPSHDLSLCPKKEVARWFGTKGGSVY